MTELSTYRLSERRTLEPGDEVSIRGARGRWRFRYATVSSDGLVSLTFTGSRGFRSFRPERVATVHRKQTMRAAR